MKPIRSISVVLRTLIHAVVVASILAGLIPPPLVATVASTALPEQVAQSVANLLPEAGVALAATVVASDTFASAVYTGGSGWNGNWIESDAAQSATAGNVLITAGELRLAGSNSVSRTVNMANVASATLSLSYRKVASAANTSVVEICSDSSFSNCQTVVTTTSVAAIASTPLTVTVAADKLTANTVFRTRISGYTTAQFFYIDNILLTPSAPGLVEGVAFNDVNYNGRQDAGEPPLANIAVRAVDANGTVATATTGANGSYTILTSAGLTGTARLEFTLPSDGSLDYMKSTVAGSTTVQFVNLLNGAQANVGFLDPSNYSQANPDLATSLYVNGDINTTAPTDALVKFAYNSSGTTPARTAVATKAQIGTTWGLAYARSTKMLYAAAFLKRNAGIGPNGLGAIYAINTTSGAPTLFADLTTLGVNVGTVLSNSARGLGLPTATSNDPTTFDQIGKVGLGDLDISDDESTLYVVNLNDNKLYALNLPAATLAGSYAIPDPGCIGGAWRPFALKFKQGSLYVGGVCDAQSSQNRANMQAYVYRFIPGSNTFTQVLNFPLNYPKGAATGPTGALAFSGWYPWLSTFAIPPINLSVQADNVVVYPQPMFSDIEFDVDGSMILGFMDRFGHQMGDNNVAPSGATLYAPLVGGDILRAALTNGAYVLENNGTAGTVTTAGANTNQGPGGGEFYLGENFQTSSAETSVGGLALKPGSGEVALTVMDPLAFITGGVAWLSNTTGGSNRRYQIFDATRRVYFGKANGLGDLELLVNPAPLEIGNRIWYDADGDGVQDPNEPPLAGVQVTLQGITGTLATVTTDANGLYLFSGYSGTTISSKAYSLTLATNSNYTISVPTVVYSGTQVLGLTSANTDGGINGDLHDSDASQANGTILVATAGAGSNNHTYDIGYEPPDPSAISVSKLVQTSDGSPVPSLAGGFSITVNCPGQAGFPSTQTINNGQSVSFSNLAVGTVCTVSEDISSLPAAPIGYVWGALQINAPSITVINAVTATLAVKNILAPVTPITGSLTLTKTVMGSSRSDYTVTVTGPSYPSGQNFAITTGSNTITNLLVGTYTVTELSPGAGWSTTYVVSGTTSTSSAVVTLTNSITAALVTPGQIAGTVYADFNADGNKSVAETGVQSVTVTAYDRNNTAVGSTTTNITGTWALTPTAAGPWRIEYTNLPAGYEPSRVAGGTQNGTSTQFVNSLPVASGMYFGVNHPADYSSSNSGLATNVYIAGDTNATAPTATLVKFPYSSATMTTVATKAQIGSTWGLAYARTADNLFAAAFLKRHVGLYENPTGTPHLGQIFLLTKAQDGGGSATPFFDVATVPGVSLGSIGSNVSRGLGAPTAPSRDDAAYSLIGRTGLGDLDISDDESTLWAVSLNDQKLLSIPVNDPTAGSVQIYAIPNPGCTGGNWRPFAVKYYRSQVYIGGVCDAATSQLKSDLRAVIYRFNGSTFATALSFSLNFTKDFADDNCQNNRGWYPWASTFPVGYCFANRYVYPQPILSDIEFDTDGSLILGFIDRFGHQMGLRNYDPFVGADANTNMTIGGDIMRAVKSGSGFTLPKELTAGSEFYTGDLFSPFHLETSDGGLAMRAGTGEIALTAMDPTAIDTGGVSFLSNTTGAKNRGYQAYVGFNNTTGFFGKAAGMGDLELLSDPAPIEIGNRVWNDLNNNGVQDPGESALSGVVVTLQTPVGTITTTTNLSGTYYFTREATTGAYSTTLRANTAYTITINPNQTALTGYGLTLANTQAISGSTTSNDAILDTRDSDAIVVGGLATIYYTTGSDGDNNHGLDFGFTPRPQTSMSITNTAPPSLQIVKEIVGGTVGDAFPVTLFGPGGTVTPTTVTAGTPTLFENIAPGVYTVTEGTLPAAPTGYTWGTPFYVPSNATVNVVAGTLAEVKIVNILSQIIDPITGTLTLTKTVVGSPRTDYTVTVTGPSYPSGQLFVINSGTNTITNLLAGVYTVTETSPGAGWTTTYVVSGTEFTSSGVVSLTNPAPVAGSAPAASNVARNKSATLSTTGTASNGVDGNTATAATSTSSANPWWLVDLGQVTDIVSLTLRTAVAANLSNSIILISDVPFTSTLYTQTLSQPGVITIAVGTVVVNANTLFTPTVGTSGRYIRIQRTTAGNTILHLNEVEVWGAGTGIAGTVYNDYNSDGNITANGGVTDSGVAGVLVTAYDNSNTAIASATSDINGQYDISMGLTAGVAYRLEFTNLPAGYEPSRVYTGTQNGTSTQFVSAPASNANLGVVEPCDYCQNNPTLVVPIYRNGDPLGGGTSGTQVNSYGIAYNASGTNPGAKSISTHDTTGAIWGQAYQRESKQLLRSAVVRRHDGLGSGGIGAIYRTDMSGTPSTSLWVNLETLGVDFGSIASNSDRGLLATSNSVSVDAQAFPLVGKAGIGGIELSTDGTMLYVMNLYDRKLYQATVGNPLNAPTSLSEVGSMPWLASNPCTNGEARPWAVKQYRDVVYVGVVCSAEYESADLPTLLAQSGSPNLDAYIYAYDAGSWTQVLSVPLDYAKGETSSSRHGTNIDNDWLSWTDVYTRDTTAGAGVSVGASFYNDTGRVSRPQPILSDLAFDSSGNMILGFMDRGGMQMGWSNRTPDYTSGTELIQYNISGDILRACGDASSGWTLEQAGVCGGVTGGGANGQGPAGGEFYAGDVYSTLHYETMNGALATLAGASDVASAAMDPFNIDSGGVYWMSNLDGSKARAAQLYAESGAFTGATSVTNGSFGKAGAMGDIAILCDPAPIEIGNRVWSDLDNDGIQDASEPALSGVVVTLQTPAGTIQTTTDINGRYLFTREATSGAYSTTLRTNTQYTITINPAQSALTGYALTQANTQAISGSTTSNNAILDTRDSDAYQINGIPTIYYTTGSAGQNNHGLDFGFTPQPKTDLSIVNTAPPTLEIIKDFVGGSTADVFPVTLYGPGGTVTPTTVTAGTPTVFENIVAGIYTVTEGTLPTPPTGYTWGTPLYSPNSVVAVQAGTLAKVTIVNVLSEIIEPITGTLTLTKTVVGNPRTAYSVTLTGPSYPTGQTIDIISGTNTIDNLLLGVYTVTEFSPGTGWSITYTVGAVNSTVNGLFTMTNPISATGGIAAASNLALGKSATQASTTTTNVASNAVDASTATAATTLGTAPNPWWEVDLGQVSDIVSLTLRTATIANLSNSIILISDVPFTSTLYTQTVSQPGVYTVAVGTMVANVNTVFNAPSGAMGRYIRIQRTVAGNSTLQLNDVQVWGAGTGIAGTVYSDNNTDGVQSGTEGGVAGVLVTAYDNSNVVVGSTTTDISGQYDISSGLTAGVAYRLEFTNLPNGYEPSRVYTGTQNGTSTQFVNAAPTANLNFAIISPTITTTLAVELGNRIWNDLDNNGVQDAGEPGLSGVVVSLQTVSGTITTTTSITGTYLFTREAATGAYSRTLRANTSYTITINPNQTALTGYALTQANTQAVSGSPTSNDALLDTRDSDAYQIDGIPTIYYTTGSGVDSNHGLDVGFSANPQIGMSITNTSPATLQIIKEFVGGATSDLFSVTLYGPGGIVSPTTVTAGTPTVFENIPTGTYSVTEGSLPTPPAGYEWGMPFYVPATGAAVAQAGSLAEIKIVNILSKIIEPVTGTLTLTKSVFGADIGGYEITLDGPSYPGGQLFSIISGTNTITNLLPGVYTVTESSPSAGWVTTYTVGGSDYTDYVEVTLAAPGEATGSVPATSNLALGKSATQASTTTTNVASNAVDASTATAATTLGTAPNPWWQVDLGQVSDIVSLTLRTATIANLSNSIILISDVPFTSTLYTQTVSQPGVYTVAVGTMVANVNTVFNAPSAATGRYIRIQRTVAGNSTLQLNDVQVWGVGTGIAGTVYNDVALDGNVTGFGVTDTGVANVLVTAYDQNGLAVGSATSDINGRYDISSGLTAGVFYRLEFTELPAGYAPSRIYTGTQNGSSTQFVSAPAGDTYFALALPISTDPIDIGNRVWKDLNNDGIQDANEPGLSGVVVSLQTVSGTITTTTNITGSYLFTREATTGAYSRTLRANTVYSIMIDPNQPALSGYALTRANQQAVSGASASSNDPISDTRDSDAYLIDSIPTIYYVTDSTGGGNHGLDFGFSPNPQTGMSIANYAPPALRIIKEIIGGTSSENFPVTVYGPGGAVISTTVNTDTPALLENIEAGTYTVVEGMLPAAPDGYEWVDAISYVPSGGVIDAALGQIVEVKIVNILSKIIEPITGTLTLTKSVVGSNLTDYEITLSGPSYPSGQNFDIISGTNTIPNLLAGVYTVVETSPGTGWVTTYTVSTTVSATSGVISMTNPITAALVAPGQITGTVYADYNEDGAKASNELGVATVTVTAYDRDGNAVGSATTNLSGTFALTPTTSGPWRFEYTDLPLGFEPSRVFTGTQNGTSVQFVNSLPVTGGLFFGINVPADYVSASPLLASPRYYHKLSGFQTLLSWNYNNRGLLTAGGYPAPTGEAIVDEIGTTWGLAYRRSTKDIFAASFVRRHGSIPDVVSANGLTTAASDNVADLGVIYRVTQDGNTANNSNVRWVNLDGATDTDSNTIDVGTLDTDSARGINITGPSNDPTAFDAVGKHGLGDVDISDDESDLWVVNLNERKLHAIAIQSDGTAGAIRSFALPTAQCNGIGANNDTRPFAVKYYRGYVYVGVVCSGENTQDLATMNAYVFRLLDDNVATTFTQVLTFNLNYARQAPDSTNGCSVAAYQKWQPWRTTIDAFCLNTRTVAPQPVLSDIEFDSNGDMIVGLMDRYGHQVNTNNYGLSGTTLIGTVSAGDILRAPRQSSSLFTIETAATDANIATEYYIDNFVDTGNGAGHSEITVGGLALIPGNGKVVATAFDPLNGTGAAGVYNAGGVIFLDNATGTRTGTTDGYQVFNEFTTGTVGKSSGMGDLELLSDPAPIEIGNRVWNDLNNNGVQDPGEPALSGVVVSLQTISGTITTTTNISGTYIFTREATTGAYSRTLRANTAYVISINPNQSALSGYSLTLANQQAISGDPASNDAILDTRDSDAALVSGVPSIYYTTGSAGQNNHGLDFGFSKVANGAMSITNVAPASLQIDKAVMGGDSSETFTVTVSGPNGYNVITTVTSSEVRLLTDLEAGTYSVVEGDLPAAPSGKIWAAVQTTPNSGSITLQNATTGFFTVTNYLAEVSTPITGSLTLTKSVLGSIRTSFQITLTGPSYPSGQVVNIISGTNTITNLNPGIYTITEVSPGNGWVTTYTVGTIINTTSAVISLTNSITAAVVSAARITGTVYADSNVDGNRLASELGVAGVLITAYDRTGAAVGFTTTNASGIYSLTPSASGPWRLEFSNLPAGYEPSRIYTGTQNGTTQQFVLSAPISNVNLAIISPTITTTVAVEIGNRVWWDQNGDGVQDAGEPALAGVPVTLTWAGGSIATTTNITGSYIFTREAATGVFSRTLATSKAYTIQFGTPAGYILTVANAQALAGASVTSNDAISDVRDSDAYLVNGIPTIYYTTGSAGQNNHGLDVGFSKTFSGSASIANHYVLPPAQFGDRVWIESGGDGLAATGTITPVQALVITATDGTNIFTTTTTSDGYYSFTVPAGTYTVSYGEVPFSYGTVVPSTVVSGTSESGNAGSYHEAGNPDANHGQDTVVTIGDGESNWHVDFAFTPTLQRFGDRLWLESDSDGDATSNFTAPVANKVITATHNNGTVFTTTTDNDGFYTFTVPAGTYTVTYGLPPTGYRVSSTPGGNVVDAASSGDDTSHENYTLVTLNPSEIIVTVDFGFNPIRASLQIDKIVVGGVVGDSFTMLVSGPSYSGTVEVVPGVTTVLSDLIPGTYTLVETGIPAAPAGLSWTEVRTVPSDGSISLSGNTTGTISVFNYLGELPVPVTGTLTLTKTVVGSSQSDYEISLTGPSYPAGQLFNIISGTNTITNLIPGIYTVTETSPGAGWTTSYTTTLGTGGNSNAVVSLQNVLTATPFLPTSNVVIGKLATQSADYTVNTTANLAVDGNTDGNLGNGSVAVANVAANAWWQVDLGASYTISNIVLWSRTDGFQSQASNLRVFVSDTPFVSQDYNTTLTQVGVSNYQLGTAVAGSNPIAVNRNGRYVRVQLEGTNYLSLAEVQVFAQAISGIVFRDFNSDGQLSKGTSNDIGVSGVNVTVYGQTGNAIGNATTDAFGSYIIPMSDVGPYRVEFTNLPSGYEPSRVYTGTQNGTSTQFVNTTDGNVNFAINHPADYSQSNPYLYVPQFWNGSASGSNAMSRFRFDTTGEQAVTTDSQIGSVWGLAYARQSQSLYASAFLKRHTGIGPGGLGAIYVIPNATGTTVGTPSVFATVPNVGTVASNVTRGVNVTGDTPNTDAGTFDQVGKVGLGDIDISNDESTLWTVNLNERTLVKIPVTNPSSQTTYAIPLNSCALNTDAAGSAIRVNAAGVAFPDSGSPTRTWLADTAFTGGALVQTANTITNINNPGDGTGTSGQTLYQGMRYGAAFAYTFYVPDGTYTVRVHFADVAGAVNRAFSVKANGTTKLSGVNPYGLAGNQVNRAVAQSFATNVTGGKLLLDFVDEPGGDGNAIVSGIEVISQSGNMPSGEFRPFATKVYRDMVYVGGVCNAEYSQDREDLSATVYQFNPATATFTDVFTMPLNYTKGRPQWFCDNQTVTEHWNPWISEYLNGYKVNCDEATQIYPSPMLSDIEFDVDGSMILGFMDRFGHQTGWANRFPDGTATEYGVTGGDVLRAGNLNGSYQLESNGLVTSTLFGKLTGTTGNSQGPGGGEFYNFDYARSFTDHQETSMGGLALMPGSQKLVMSAMDPDGVWVGGATWGSNLNGALLNWLVLQDNIAGGLRKGGAQGDIELLSDPAPIEIGNRVWSDVNNNGVQDPGEPALAGVVVSLQTISGTITTTTNISGTYYFTREAATGAYSTTLRPNTAYTITINPNQAVLNAFALTLANQQAISGSTTSNDAILDTRDSDAYLVNGLASIYYTTGSAGQNNHGLDFGFSKSASGSMSITNTAPIPASLQIVKEVTGGTSSDPFTVTVSGPAGYSIITTVTTSAVRTLTNLTPGTYTVTESSLPGAPSGLLWSGTIYTPTAGTISLGGGLTGVVTITNQLSPIPSNPATLIIDKVVTGGSSAGPFTMTVTGPGNFNQTVSVVPGTPVTLTNLSAGVYTVTESSLPGAPVGFTWDTASYNPANGEITLSEDMTGTVTVTNPLTPTLQRFGDRLWLESDNDGDATTNFVAPVANKLITATEQSGTVYTTLTDNNGFYTFTVPAGTYTVTYGLPPVGYQPSSTPAGGVVGAASGGNDQSHLNQTVVTLNPGEIITTVDFGFGPQLSHLTLVKTVNVPTAYAGDVVTFTLTLTNDGTGPATGVVVTDYLPATLEYITYTASSGIYSDSTGEWSLPTVPVGTETLTMTVRVK